MIGAMVLRSPTERRSYEIFIKTKVHKRNDPKEQRAELTNDNEGHGNDEGEDVSADGFVVLAVSLGEEV